MKRILVYGLMVSLVMGLNSNAQAISPSLNGLGAARINACKDLKAALDDARDRVDQCIAEHENDWEIACADLQDAYNAAYQAYKKCLSNGPAVPSVEPQ